MDICNFVKKCKTGGCSSDIPSSYFFYLSKIWSMLHHGLVGHVQNKVKNALYISRYFLTDFVFHNNICVFIFIYVVNMAYFL